MGRRKLTYEELDDAFTGIVLTFEKKKEFRKSKKERTLFSFIKMRLRGQYSSITALIGIGLLLVFPGMVIPVFSQVFIDDILLGGNTDWMTAFLAIMAFTMLFQAALTLYRSLLLLKLQNKMSMISAHKFLYHMFRLPMNFFDQRYAGDLAERVELMTDLWFSVSSPSLCGWGLAAWHAHSPLMVSSRDLGSRTYCSNLS